MDTNNISRSKEDVVFDIINYIFLGIVLIVCLYPLYFIVIASFSDPVAVNSGDVIIAPIKITFEGYTRLFQDEYIWRGYRNTVMYTILGTALNIFLTMMISYPLSRKRFSGRNILTIFLMITVYFNGGLIPTYLLVKNLDLIDKWPVIILFGALIVHNVIISRVVLQNTITEDLFEAATIDGCSHFTFFFKFVLPLSKALIAVLGLYYGVAHWNEFFNPLIYLRDDKLYPLQLILRSILIKNENSTQLIGDIESQVQAERIAELIKYGVIIVSSIPVLAIYPFLQKYFVKGVMLGSLKG